ncbi:kinase-like domain-containing protein [Lentinula aciculospora]|uniref:Kinase-like domain-containing protein n=1 Tax=Lentinula aciculospora TaxID=153920 RepID=A0A9W8ZZE2_9AGAR|nr:kinase-like domain-containing protein [Lentinula aciculospora]
MDMQLQGVVSLNSNLQRALDEYGVFKCAKKLNRNLQREPLPWLGATEAQRIMVDLQAELDLNKGSETHRRACFSLICYLVKKLRALPLSLLVIKDVKRVGRNPVAGGGFADIWRGNMNGEAVCLKVLRLVIEQDERTRATVRKRFCREALVWRQLKHPNILPLLGVNLELFLPSFCLISPWMENKDIITYSRQNPNHNLYHAANILVTNNSRCCLADFGLALVTADVTQAWSITSSGSIQGALRWMAPEYLQSNGSTPTPIHLLRDVYAFGCTVVENLPFHHCKTEYTVLCSLMEGERPDRPKNTGWCTDNIWELVSRCWAQCAQDRPSSDEISKILCKESETKHQQEQEILQMKVQHLVRQIQKKKLGKGKERVSENGRRMDTRKKLLGSTDCIAGDYKTGDHRTADTSQTGSENILGGSAGKGKWGSGDKDPEEAHKQA